MKLFILGTLYVFPQKAVHKVPLRWSEWGNGPRYVRARTPIQTRGSEKLPDLRHSAEVVNSRPYVPTHDHLRTHILGRDRRDIFWKYVVVCRRRDAVIWSSINQCTQLINQAAAHRWRQTK